MTAAREAASRRRARIRLALDVAAGVAIAGAGAAERLAADRDWTAAAPLDIAAVAVLGGAVALRSRLPRACTWALLLVLLVQTVALSPPQTFRVGLLPVLLLAYTAGATLLLRPLTVWAAGYVVLIEVATVRLEVGVAADLVFYPAVGLGAVAAGRAARRRAQLVAQLARTTRQLEDQGEATARRAVAEERRRIAHELHDVVAHAISVMVVQAGGGRRILATDVARARDAAAEVERTGREALLEMRRLLAVLRDPDRPAEREPNPTLDGLPALIERLRSGGLRVHFEETGEPRPVTAGLGLGAYRVVQDALEDVARATPDAHCDIHLHWGDDALELRVTDDSVPDEPADGDEPGLLGVRERVAVYGGTVTRQPLPAGGHELSVSLPLDLAQPAGQPTGGAA